MNTMNDNTRIKTTPPRTTLGPGSGIDSRTKTDAINACRLMDTILSTPSFHQGLFTDSVQLFPNHILQDTRLQNHNTNSNSQQQTQDLNTIMTGLQSLLETTRLEINKALSKNPTWKSASSSLEMDTSTLSAFDNASHQLMHAMHTFHNSYQQYNTSQHVLAYHQQQQRGSHPSSEQDTIPGLGEAVKVLRSTQEALLNMMLNIRAVQDNLALLTDPSSMTSKAIASVQQDLIRGSGDPGVEAHLDRLYTMSATLERALQRE
ncbi:hypothetical protein BG015_011493 [Linnemannia schmuckeri]|uniref:Uncharacterized protein n=1 Tax=Linnemannia schmuckeri TaxID=64567 RepID=A0A9P5RSZ1_9FUNG|nr:hypothetical protein BG015_011493 [Linnemannia schmuckeri]